MCDGIVETLNSEVCTQDRKQPFCETTFICPSIILVIYCFRCFV